MTAAVAPAPAADVDAKAVAFVAVARASDQVVIAQFADRSTSAREVSSYETTVAELLQRAARLPAYPGWMGAATVAGLSEDDAGARVHALADVQALCVVAVAVRGGRGYPERLVRPLLQELVGKVRATESDERLSEARAGKLTSSLRCALKDVVRTYNDPGKLDKVTAVHEKVDKVKDLMQDNVRKILETHTSLEALQTKSTSMAASADQFLKQSTGLRRQLQLRNLRVKAIIGMCSLGLVAYVLMPFIDC